MMILKQSTSATIKFGPFLDETDGKTAETGLTISQADIRLSKNGGNIAQTNDATGATHDELGFYDVPLDATDTNTLGRLLVAVHESGALPVWREFMVIPANEFDSLISGTDALDVEVASVATAAITADAIAADAIGASELAQAAADQVWSTAARVLTANTNLNDPTAASIADAVWEEAIADHSGTAGSTAELLQDIDNEVDEIHAQIDSIAVTGSALNQIAESDTLAVGTETSGTYASTQASDDTRHILTAATNEIDIYYQFDIGVSGVPVSVQIEGYLKEGAPAGGDTIDLYAYDWIGTAWELVHPAIFTGILGDVDETAVHTLFSRHVGTAGNDGIVRVRFQAASLEAGTTLNIDQIFVSFAESIAADVAAILVDTNELQTDWTNDGRLDVIADSILADTNELQTDDVPGLIAALPTAVENRTEMDSNSTQLAAIVADTNELQVDDVPGLIAALNDPTAATIADAVWDEAATGHTDAGKAGEQQWTDIDAILADTNELQTDDIPGSLTTIEGKIDTVDTNVDAVLVDTNELQVDDVPGLIAALNNIAASDVTTDMDANSTQLAAIVADTNELQTDDVPGLIAALNNISVADVLTTAMTEAYAADGAAPTLAQAICLIQQSIGDFSISGTTLTVKKLDGSTGAATFTLDDGTNPTSLTRTT